MNYFILKNVYYFVKTKLKAVLMMKYSKAYYKFYQNAYQNHHICI